MIKMNIKHECYSNNFLIEHVTKMYIVAYTIDIFVTFFEK